MRAAQRLHERAVATTLELTTTRGGKRTTSAVRLRLAIPKTAKKKAARA